MAFTLDQVVPWGRSFDEYRRMFALDETDLARPILGCGDGPAGFNAEATARGARVVSCDPLYHFSAAEIAARIAATSDVVLEQARANRDRYVWDEIGSVEALGRLRHEAMDCFLRDYPAGLAAGRYIDAELPCLPFADDAFGLALCSHFLFLYSAHLSAAFHVAGVRELCRVARAVRIFPVLDLDGAPSPHVEPVRAAMAADGRDAALVRVPYEFQRGGDTMMRIF